MHVLGTGTGTEAMLDRSFAIILLFPLAFTSASGEESDLLRDQLPVHNPANTTAVAIEPPSGFHLRGILISKSHGSALVNDRLARVGDRVDGAVILAIDEQSVRILVGQRELTLRVGSTVGPQQLSDPGTRVAHGLRRPQSSPVQDRRTSPMPIIEPASVRSNPNSRHRLVKRGEVLSRIAEQYLSAGTTRHQVMIALFQTNLQAFDGNINALRAGAYLRVPDDMELHVQAAASATTEVLRQTDAWRTGSDQQPKMASAPRQLNYGPIGKGETLSAIAERILNDDITMNQMMIALFQANPRAFGGNINLLHEGAILRIPDELELQRLTPDVATAEVMRHAGAWRSRYQQHARSTTAPTQVMASSQEPLRRTIQPIP